jgi:alpha-ketoglutarate-dependent taurine dioxygenase
MSTTTIQIEPFRVSRIRPEFGSLVEANPGADLPDPAAVMNIFLSEGALLLRGFPFDLDAFVAFTDRCCRSFSTYVGGGIRFRALNRESMGAGGTVMTTTGSTQSFPIPLHGEMYYQKLRPDVLWFYCKQAPAEHGQTVLADGRAVFESLSAETQALLSKARLRYIRELAAADWATSFMTDDPAELKSICDANELTLELREDGSARIEYVSPAVFAAEDGRQAFINSSILLWHFERAVLSGAAASALGGSAPERPPLVVRFEDGSEIPESVIREVDEAADPLTAKIKWQVGDVVLVDNRKIMHGRRKTVGADRQVLVRLGNLA